MVLTETIVDDKFVESMQQYKVPDKSVGLIEACSKSPIVFAEYMLGIELYAWQVKFLRDLQEVLEGEVEQTEALAMTSRQVGKSMSLAVFSLWATIFNKKPGTVHNDTIVCMISRSDEQAKKLLNEVKKWLRYGDRFMRDKYKDADGKPLFGRMEGGEYKGFFSNLLSKTESNNTTTISFEPHNPEVHGPILLFGSKSSSSIRCLPPTSKVLGFSFSIGIIDEAGHESISDSFFYNDLYPTGDSTDAMWIYTSTPWDPNRFFYDFVDLDEKNETDYIRKSIFSIDALENDPNPKAANQYKKVKVKIDRLRKRGKNDEGQRAYYCRFVKGENSYFEPTDVDSCFDSDTVKLDSFDKPCDMGLDFGGQVKSRTVITISYLDDDNVIHRIFEKVYEVGKDLSLIDDISELRKRFNIQTIIYDECPAGQVFKSQMEEKGWDIHGMVFRADKIKKYGAFRAALKRGNVKSFKDDDLKAEMYGMEYSRGSTQSNIMHAPGGSDDKIDSFVMSTYFFIDDETGVKFFQW